MFYELFPSTCNNVSYKIMFHKVLNLAPIYLIIKQGYFGYNPNSKKTAKTQNRMFSFANPSLKKYSVGSKSLSPQ